MEITRSSINTGKGRPDWFTGDVYVDPIVAPSDSSRVGGGLVTSPPAHARTGTPTPTVRRSTSPRALGAAQREGGPVEEIRPGDRVFFEPDENHWHDAAPNRLMVHIAIQLLDDTGSAGTFGAPVTDQQYHGAPAS